MAGTISFLVVDPKDEDDWFFIEEKDCYFEEVDSIQFSKFIQKLIGQDMIVYDRE